MAYPSTQLISQAYWVSGIRGHDFQAISGPDLGYGLNVLNDLIGDLRVESDMIPYTSTSYSFNLVIGQQEYFIPNLTVCDTLTFFIDTVRYAMQEVPRTTFFGSSRVNGLQSLPLSYHTERALGGLNVFVYFYPDQTYPMELVGLFAPSPVTANQDLSLVWDQYFINYFKYALAERLCTEYNITKCTAISKYRVIHL